MSMEVRSPETKPEEQYPLLESNGAGDSRPTQPPRFPPGWGVQYTKKKFGCSRWPECISVCWMTTILCGITFMVIYGLGVGAYRRHQFVFLSCNDSRSANKVFFHHIVPRGEQVPFVRFSEYLAFMARQHPHLQYRVFFLIDDSTTRGPVHNRFMSKMIPFYPYHLYPLKSGENYDTLVEFQKRFQNVNVTVMPLSKYMAETPLRYKWRTIPTSFLPFYARVFSVWENGGIGMDLAVNNAMGDSPTSRKKVSILRQHNDGIDLEAYVNALNKMDKEEDTAMFSIVFSVLDRFLNETCSFFNRTLSLNPETEPEILIQSPRTKVAVSNGSSDSVPVNTEKSNSSMQLNLLPPSGLDINMFNLSSNANITDSNNTNAKVVLFYDLQIFSDSVGPPYLTQPSTPTKKVGEVSHSLSHLLAMDDDGSFIAASSRLHPLLGRLILAGCRRLAPRFAIQDAILSQCSSFIREDVYCNNIYIL